MGRNKARNSVLRSTKSEDVFVFGPAMSVCRQFMERKGATEGPMGWKLGDYLFRYVSNSMQILGIKRHTKALFLKGFADRPDVKTFDAALFRFTPVEWDDLFPPQGQEAK